MSARVVLLILLAAVAPGCGGATGTREGPPTSPSAPAGGPTLQPAATVRLSGAAASGLAEAGGWLWVTHFEASVLSQVDPRTAAEAGTLEVGANGASVTTVGSRLWIAHYTNRPGDAMVTAVEPRAAVVVGRVPLPHLCCEVAGAAGLLWAVDPRGTLLAIDPGPVRVVASTPVSLDVNVHVGLVGDERGLWLSSDTTPLLRVDPSIARVVASLDVGGGIPMALAHGLVWGAGPRHVWAVDPETNAVRVRLPLENTIEVLNLAVSDDALWVGARRPGSVGVVLRYDLASQRLTGEAAVGLPARLIFAFGSVWVVDWDANRLLRF